MSKKWRTLLWLAFAELLAMSLWFSASAVTPNLRVAWELTDGGVAWLTMAVQVGFVTGALLSAVFNVADLWPPRYVFAAGALIGAALNAAIPLFAGGLASALPLRFGTGFSLALVYPVGMKIMATWTKEDRGLGLGLLVGALTVGSASPHLARGLGGVGAWEPVLYTVSGLSALGAFIGWRWGELGPYRAAPPRFRWSYVTESLRRPSLRLANLGYLGHMWELYGMWTWIPLFLAHTFRSASTAPGDAERLAALWAFAAIGAGGVGSLLAGQLADRWGRSRTTIVSMLTSGTCAAVIGLLADGGAGSSVVVAVALLWGFAVVADSAQFSTAVTELGAREYMGTLLTTQTCLGFLLTLVSIRFVPVAVELVGWRWAFASLAIGPVLGSWAMWRLGRHPEAARLAGGRG